MLGEVVELLKKPVTTMRKKAEEKNFKKEAIIAAIIAVVIAVVSLVAGYLNINKIVNKKFPSLKKYNDNLYSFQEEVTKSEFKEMKKDYKADLLEDAELIKSFFRTFGITVAVMALIPAMLFIISKMVKLPKDYSEMLAMSNGAYIIYLLGFLLNIIFSYIYTPIGIILSVATTIYAMIALANAFRDCLAIEDSDKLTICSTIVISVVFAIALFIIYKATVGALMSGLDMLSDLSL